jgi:hypothetical protein
LTTILLEGVAVTILADRGFGDVKLFEFLECLGVGYVIRFRGNVHATAADGQRRLAADWVGKAGRARLLRGAELVGREVVCIGDGGATILKLRLR